MVQKHQSEIKQSNSDFYSLLSLCHLRRETLIKDGYWGKPAFFKIGDRVGFFYNSQSCDYMLGTLLRNNNCSGFIVGDDGNTYIVSLFSIFAV